MHKLNTLIESTWFKTWILPVVLVVIAYFSTGFYFGWLDDVVFEHYLKGSFSGEAFSDLFLYHIGLSQIISWLMKQFPDWPVYGGFIFLQLFLALVLSFKVLVSVLDRWTVKGSVQLIALCLFFFTLFYDQLYLFNYTNASLLLSGSAMLLLVKLICEKSFDNKHLLVLLLFGCFTLAYLVRPNTTLAVIWLSGASIVLLALSKSKLRKRLSILLVSIFVLVGTTELFRSLTRSADEQAFRQRWAYIDNLLNGFNFNEEFNQVEALSPADSIRFFALQTWFFQDEKQFDESFLSRVGGNQNWRASILANWKSNLHQELIKARDFYIDYYPAANWYIKIKWFILVFVLACLLSIRLITVGQRKDGFLLLLFQFLAWAFLLIVAIFIKMEDRVFSPYLILYCLSNLLLWSYWFERQRTGQFIVMACSVLLALMLPARLMSYSETASEKKAEIELKERVINELKTNFSDEFIFLDFWSMSLLHAEPFYPPKLVELKLTAYGENWMNAWQSHRDYLQAICEADPTDFDAYFSCLAESDQEIVFVLTTQRKNMLESYASILYDLPLKFTPVNNIDPFEAIKQLKYSFLWCSYDFGYYRLSIEY